jgi:cytochrome c-type biogenesis protein
MSGSHVTPITVFAAGVLSFLSPCVLPLVPGYVSLISGTSAVAAEQSEQKRLLGRVMLNSLLFVLGFSIVFIALGAAATTIGEVTREYRRELSWIAGIVIIIFGLHLTGLLKIKYLYADKRMHSVQGSSSALGSFVVGFAFAFGWTPCIGPILSAILTLAASEGTVSRGIWLLALYSAGLAMPFLLTSLGIDRFMAFYARFRRHLHKVEVISGVLLIAIGVLVLTRHLTVLSGYLSFLNRFSL